MTPKQFFYIILGVIVVTIGLSSFGYIYALHRLEGAKSTLATALGEQSADQDQIDSLVKLKATYAKEIVPELPLINQALPRTKNQTELLVQLQNIASSVGLELTSVNFPSPAGLPTQISQTTAVGTVLALPVTFGVDGSFTQLQSFLTSLEHLSRLTNVTSLTVSRADKTKPIDYSITLNAYVKP